MGRVIVYPLPAGAKPVVQKRLEMAPEVVKEHGLVYSGVHGFPSKFLWSPDSRDIGLIDCLVDYGFETIPRKHSTPAVSKRTGGVSRLSLPSMGRWPGEDS